MINNSRFTNIRDRFYFCYSSKQLKYLKDNDCHYLFKGINENTNTFFYLFDKNELLKYVLEMYKYL